MPRIARIEKREQAAEEGRVDSVFAEMLPADPDRGRRGELGVAAADPAEGEHAEGEDEDAEAAGEMDQDVLAREPRRDSANGTNTATSAIEMRFEIVIVKRSDSAANAISDGEEEERHGLQH